MTTLPSDYAHCATEGCPLALSCLRRIAAAQLPRGVLVTWFMPEPSRTCPYYIAAKTKGE